jgi:hypothetical protein
MYLSVSALALEEGWGEGIPAAWTRPATLTPSLSRREREAARRRDRKTLTRAHSNIVA